MPYSYSSLRESYKAPHCTENIVSVLLPFVLLDNNYVNLVLYSLSIALLVDVYYYEKATAYISIIERLQMCKRYKNARVQ